MKSILFTLFHHFHTKRQWTSPQLLRPIDLQRLLPKGLSAVSMCSYYERHSAFHGLLEEFSRSAPQCAAPEVRDEDVNRRSRQ